MIDFFKCIGLCLFLIFFFSCEKEYVIDLSNQETRPVVLAYAQIGYPMVVTVSTTYPINQYVSSDQITKSKADISLYVNDTLYGNLVYKNGAHYSYYVTKALDSLKLDVVSEEKLEMSASTAVPEQARQTNFEYTPNGFIDKEGEALEQIEFGLSDQALVRNYYEVYVSYELYSESQGYFSKQPWYYESNDPVLLNEDIIDVEPQSLLFSDELFDGETVQIRFGFDKAYPSDDEELKGSNFYLVSVSEGYYNYKKSLWKHLYNQNPKFFWNDNAEPISLVSNIKNGEGVFGAYGVQENRFFNAYE